MAGMISEAEHIWILEGMGDEGQLETAKHSSQIRIYIRTFVVT